MKLHTYSIAFSFAILFATFNTTNVAAQFEGMLPRVPTDANTLILIDAEKLFGSQLADRERWEARRKAAFDAGISILPPDASAVVMAARMDLESGDNDWELSLVKFAGGKDVTAVAKRFGGSIDTIAGRTAARIPGNHFVVQVSPTLLGSHTPAKRQDVSHWLLATDKTNLNETLSPYLKTAHGYATKVGTPIVMAIDVAGALSPAETLSRLTEFESIAGNKELAASLSKMAGSVQGATLGITVNNTATGAIRVDFEDSPQAFAAILKPVLLEVLKRHGAMVDDFEDWEPAVQGNTFLLKGPLSTAGARRVLSVLELPPALARSIDEAGGASPNGSGGANPSKLYFQSVKSLLDDLRAKPKTDHVQTMGQAAMWYDKYARKIDQLPVLGVDPTLISYGSDVAGGLRDANSALRGAGIRSGVRTMDNNASGSSGPSVGAIFSGGYGYGYFDMRSGARVQANQNSAIRTQERAAGVTTVQSIWKNLDEATAMIRKEMTQKYEIEF